jgi:hypothetical protein
MKQVLLRELEEQPKIFERLTTKVYIIHKVSTITSTLRAEISDYLEAFNMHANNTKICHRIVK